MQIRLFFAFLILHPKKGVVNRMQVEKTKPSTTARKNEPKPNKSGRRHSLCSVSLALKRLIDYRREVIDEEGQIAGEQFVT
jgi:hypothetical protein